MKFRPLSFDYHADAVQRFFEMGERKKPTLWVLPSCEGKEHTPDSEDEERHEDLQIRREVAMETNCVCSDNCLPSYEQKTGSAQPKQDDETIRVSFSNCPTAESTCSYENKKIDPDEQRRAAATPTPNTTVPAVVTDIIRKNKGCGKSTGRNARGQSWVEMQVQDPPGLTSNEMSNQKEENEDGPIKIKDKNNEELEYLKSPSLNEIAISNSRPYLSVDGTPSASKSHNRNFLGQIVDAKEDLNSSKFSSAQIAISCSASNFESLKRSRNKNESSSGGGLNGQAKKRKVWNVESRITCQPLVQVDLSKISPLLLKLLDENFPRRIAPKRWAESAISKRRKLGLNDLILPSWMKSEKFPLRIAPKRWSESAILSKRRDLGLSGLILPIWMNNVAFSFRAFQERFISGLVPSKDVDVAGRRNAESDIMLTRGGKFGNMDWNWRSTCPTSIQKHSSLIVYPGRSSNSMDDESSDSVRAWQAAIMLAICAMRQNECQPKPLIAIADVDHTFPAKRKASHSYFDQRHPKFSCIENERYDPINEDSRQARIIALDYGLKLTPLKNQKSHVTVCNFDGSCSTAKINRSPESKDALHPSMDSTAIEKPHDYGLEASAAVVAPFEPSAEVPKKAIITQSLDIDGTNYDKNQREAADAKASEEVCQTFHPQHFIQNCSVAPGAREEAHMSPIKNHVDLPNTTLHSGQEIIRNELLQNSQFHFRPISAMDDESVSCSRTTHDSSADKRHFPSVMNVVNGDSQEQSTGNDNPTDSFNRTANSATEEERGIKAFQPSSSNGCENNMHQQIGQLKRQPVKHLEMETQLHTEGDKSRKEEMRLSRNDGAENTEPQAIAAQGDSNEKLLSKEAKKLERKRKRKERKAMRKEKKIRKKEQKQTSASGNNIGVPTRAEDDEIVCVGVDNKAAEPKKAIDSDYYLSDARNRTVANQKFSGQSNSQTFLQNAQFERKDPTPPGVASDNFENRSLVDLGCHHQMRPGTRPRATESCLEAERVFVNEVEEQRTQDILGGMRLRGKPLLDRANLPKAALIATEASISKNFEEDDDSIYVNDNNTALPGGRASNEFAMLSPIKLICSEAFIETWGENIAELASGRWTHSKIRDAHKSVKHPIPDSAVLGRKVLFFDSSLVDKCGVDVELPGGNAIIVSSLSSWPSDEASSKAFVMSMIQKACTERYREILLLLCIDTDITEDSANKLLQLNNAMLQTPVPVRCHVSSWVSLSATLAMYVIEKYSSMDTTIYNTTVGHLSDDKICDRAKFLVSLLPTMNAVASVRCLTFPTQATSPTEQFQSLLGSEIERRKFLGALRSRPAETQDINPKSLIQLSVACKTCLKEY